MNNFKNLISSRRKELKMTQKDLAQKLNVSDKTVSKWETGTSYPEITLLATIAKVLEININDLLGVDDLQEKQIIVGEQNTYNEEIITKYKTKIYLTISLIFIGLALLLAVRGITNSDLQIIMIVLGLAIYAFSIVFFIGNNLDFRGYYKRKFYTHEYDSIFAKFSSIIIAVYALPFIIITYIATITITEYSLQTYITNMNLLSIIFVILSYIFIFYILNISSYKIIKDNTNKILGIISILSFLLYIGGIIPYYFLPLIYLMPSIILFRNKYINNK